MMGWLSGGVSNGSLINWLVLFVNGTYGFMFSSLNLHWVTSCVMLVKTEVQGQKPR